MWASWCGPCRFEFPWFQSLAEKRGGQIAFLGVNSNDSDGAAEAVPQRAARCPTPPTATRTCTSPRTSAGRRRPSRRPPSTTAAASSSSRHPGVYADEHELVADVERYAQADNELHGPRLAIALLVAALLLFIAEAHAPTTVLGAARGRPRWSAPASPGATPATTCRSRRSCSPASSSRGFVVFATPQGARRPPRRAGAHRLRGAGRRGRRGARAARPGGPGLRRGRALAGAAADGAEPDRPRE